MSQPEPFAVDRMADGNARELLLLGSPIRDLADEIAAYERNVRERTIGNITEEQEKGPDFEAGIMSYIGALRFARRVFAAKISVVSQSITQTFLCSQQENENIKNKLWLELMLALKPLSGRPSKKHSCLLVDAQNRLVAWDVARVPDGIEPSAALYVQRDDVHRGAWIRCAEQNCMAKALGITASGKGCRDLVGLAEVGKAYFEDIVLAAVSSQKLSFMTMYAQMPCNRCADFLIDSRSGSLILNGLMAVEEGDKLTNAVRKPKEALRRFRECGTSVRILSRHQLSLSYG